MSFESGKDMVSGIPPKGGLPGFFFFFFLFFYFLSGKAKALDPIPSHLDSAYSSIQICRHSAMTRLIKTSPLPCPCLLSHSEPLRVALATHNSHCFDNLCGGYRVLRQVSVGGGAERAVMALHTGHRLQALCEGLWTHLQLAWHL